MESQVICIACGKCCKKHWLIHLMGAREMKLFKNHLVFGEYVWTDKCPYFRNNKCSIHDNKPYKCKEYLCEKHNLNGFIPYNPVAAKKTKELYLLI
jgi:Fe-S-cluster containining protein